MGRHDYRRAMRVVGAGQASPEAGGYRGGSLALLYLTAVWLQLDRLPGAHGRHRPGDITVDAATAAVRQLRLRYRLITMVSETDFGLALP
jgi:hypothetical protein